jgi:hypothetical protein
VYVRGVKFVNRIPLGPGLGEGDNKDAIRLELEGPGMILLNDLKTIDLTKYI